MSGRKTTGLARLGAGLIATAWMLSGQAFCAGPGDGRPGDQFEPPVSRKEAELLRTVAAVGATNAARAIALLTESDMEKSSAALDFALGNLRFQSEQMDAAAQAYLNALKKLPRFRAAIMNLGRVYLMQGKAQAAIGLYHGMVQDGRAGADMLILLGHALLMENSAVSAESAYRQALLLSPNDKDALAGLAKCLFIQERYREGLSLLKELQKSDYGSKEYWSLRANALIGSDKPDLALQALETARRLKTADHEMLATLADLYLNANQPDEALACYEEAFAGGAPSVPRMLGALEGMLLARKPEHAGALIAKVEKVLQSRPDLFAPEHRLKLLRLKADLSGQTGDVKAARELCAEILRENPRDGRTLLTLGDLHRDAGEMEDAVMAYERAARISEYEARALLRQAQVEVERERYSRAVELLETAQAFEDQPNVARYLEQVRRLAQYTERSEPPEAP